MQILNRLNLNLYSFCMSQFLFPIHLSPLISKSVYLPTWGFVFLSIFPKDAIFVEKLFFFSFHTSVTLSTLFCLLYFILFFLYSRYSSQTYSLPKFLPQLPRQHSSCSVLQTSLPQHVFFKKNHPNQGNRVLKLGSSGVHSPTCSISSTKVSDRFRL